MKHLLIFLIKKYQKYISPAKAPCCRFTPTCSAYAVMAISERGALIGTALSVYRILRCNPLCKGGYDPIPPRIKGAKRVRPEKDVLFLSDKVFGRR